MSVRPDPDLAIATWLGDEAREGAPARLLTATRQQIESTHQRRAWWPAWRLREMNTYMKIAIAAAAVVVVAFVGINLLPRSGGIGPPAPTPTVAPSPTASPTSTPAPTPAASPASIPDALLAAGNYATQPFAGSNAFGLCSGQTGCTESPVDDSIRVTFTVPDGWAGVFGSTIVRTVESNSPPGGAGLGFGRGGWLYSKPCGRLAAPDIPTGTTVDEFVKALVDHPDLDVTSPVDVTLAGYSGKYLELQAPANIATEQDSPKAGECTYYWVWGTGIYAQGPNHLWHIWVLDVEGVRVLVRSETYPGTTPKVHAELQAIVDSIKIQP